MFALLAQKRFAPLFWTQFLSAFNDNFLKNALIFLIMYKMAGAECGIADYRGRRRLHPALLHPVRPRRPVGRPLRQGDDRAAAETGRMWRGPRRGRRLRPAIRAAAVRGARPVRDALDPVRPDQIRHPARPSAEIGTPRRQRADRGRDLHRHPARHHRRRPRLARRRRSGENLGGHAAGRCRLLRRQPLHSLHGRRSA